MAKNALLGNFHPLIILPLRWLNSSLNTQISISSLSTVVALSFTFLFPFQIFFRSTWQTVFLPKFKDICSIPSLCILSCQSFLQQPRARSSILLPLLLPSLSEDIPFVFRVEILKSSSAHSIWVVYFAIKKPPSPLWTWSRKLPLLCVRCHTWNLSSSLQHFKKKYAC